MGASLTHLISRPAAIAGRSRKLLRLAPLALLVLFVSLVGTPHAAMAQAITLGEVFCNAAANIAPFYYLFAGIAYILGAYFIGHGLVLIVKHYDNPRETPFINPIMHLIGGTCLLVLPHFIGYMLNTLGLYGTGTGGMPVCMGYIAAPAAGVGLDGLILNLVGNITDPITVLVSIIAVLIGVLMVFRGLVKASRLGYDPRGTKPSHIYANLIVGAALIVVGQSLGTMLATLFGTGFISSSSDVLSWGAFSGFPAADPSTGRFVVVVQACLRFVQLVGMIAFVRGWVIVRNAIEGTGQASLPQGFTHILGGVCAINIFAFLEMMDATFGTGLL